MIPASFFLFIVTLFLWCRTQLVSARASGLSSNEETRLLVPRTTLRFTANGTFKISVFEDLHYGEAEDMLWGPEQDRKSEVVLQTILRVEAPQLAVLNGDLITGENTFVANSTAYVDEIVRPLVQQNALWASTYGNHDSDFNLSRTLIFGREKMHQNSLTQNMVPSDSAGVTNYYLPVFPPDEESTTPALILWFFDSRGGYYYQQRDAQGGRVPQPGWVDQSVVDWFTVTKSALTRKYGRVIPSLAFYHIPVNAMTAYQKLGIDRHFEPGINDDNPLAQQGVGIDGQYHGNDIPFMSALLNTPGLMATFSGHDHGDDWCFKWQGELPGMNLTGNGLNLCFGRHSGYGGYGSWTRGSRQILLHSGTLNSSIETWIRLEDGTASGRVKLNSTYGHDRYPSVVDSYTYE